MLGACADRRLIGVNANANPAPARRPPNAADRSSGAADSCRSAMAAGRVRGELPSSTRRAGRPGPSRTSDRPRFPRRPMAHRRGEPHRAVVKSSRRAANLPSIGTRGGGVRHAGRGSRQCRRRPVRWALAADLHRAARRRRTANRHRGAGAERLAPCARHRLNAGAGAGPRHGGAGHGRAAAGTGGQGDPLARVRRVRQHHRPRGAVVRRSVALGASRAAAGAPRSPKFS